MTQPEWIREGAWNGGDGPLVVAHRCQRYGDGRVFLRAECPACQITRYERALQEIAAIDYRGNRSRESEIAWSALHG